MSQNEESEEHMNDLKDIDSFGGIDADADALLDECFQDHEAYNSLLSHERFLVVGRKGSGKTAIFRELIRTRSYDLFSFGHTFSDYPWYHHDFQATAGVPEEDRYTHSWRYLILLTASKVLLNQDQSVPWSEDAVEVTGKLESFVVDSYGSRDPDLSQLFVPDKKLRVNPTLGLAGSAVKLGLNLERVPVKELPKIIQEVNRSILEAVVSALNPDHQYFVCFDQLDLNFDPSEPKYAQRLIGLILAARDISLRAREAGKRLTVAVFLRDDIYQILRIEDKNKISENFVSRIEWDSPHTKWTLRDIMERRFGKVLGIDPTGSWDRVFDESQEMRGRQTKYKHMLDRTFGRPRDMIKFCNETLYAYRQRAANSPLFENPDLITARDGYSEYLLNELEDEVFKHIPDLEEYVELLKGMGTLQFSHERFDQEWERRGADSGAGTAAMEALRRMFEFSVVAYLRTGGGKGGSQYVWKYLDPRARFDAAATNFRVHSGFKEILGLKEGYAE